MVDGDGLIRKIARASRCLVFASDDLHAIDVTTMDQAASPREQIVFDTAAGSQARYAAQDLFGGLANSLSGR
jgi:hypothetical protein